MILKVVVCVVIAATAIAISIEIRSWLRGRRTISKPQKIYRLAAAIVLETVLTMILISSAITSHKGTVFIISYWTAALAFSFVLVVLALLDVRATLAGYMEQRKEIYKSLISKARDKE